MKTLNPKEVKIIVQLLELNKFKDGEIAQLFGVCRKTINNIKNGWRWSSTTGITRINDIENNTTSLENKYINFLEEQNH